VLAKKKKPATGATTGSWTDLMRQEQFDRLHNCCFVRQDFSYEEAFKLLPAIKCADLWKNCNDPHGTPPQHRDGGLEPDEWAGLYFQPSAQDRETAKEHSAIRAGDFGLLGATVLTIHMFIVTLYDAAVGSPAVPAQSVAPGSIWTSPTPHRPIHHQNRRVTARTAVTIPHFRPKVPLGPRIAPRS
jgi:hypothetical protein